MKSLLLLYVEHGQITLASDDNGGRHSIDIAEKSGAEAGRLVVAEIQLRNWIGRRTVVALGSQRVFSGRLKIERAIARRPAAVAYQLEERFPIDAEEMLFEKVDLGDGTYFAVATSLPWLRDFATELLAVNLQVSAIVPSSLLIAQHLVVTRAIPASGAVVMAGAPPVETISLRNGLPFEWDAATYSADMLGINARWKQLTQAQRPESTTIQYGEAESWCCVDRAVDGGQFISALQTAAAPLARSEFKPWIQYSLRRIVRAGASWESRQLTSALLTSIILIGVFCSAAFLLRSWRLQSITAGLQDEKAAIAVKLLSDEVHIRSPERELQIERDRLARFASGIRQINQKPSALTLLYQVLQAYPESRDTEVSKVQVFPDRAHISGTVSSLDELDRLSKAFQESGMRVEQIRYALGFELLLENAVATNPGREVDQP